MFIHTYFFLQNVQKWRFKVAVNLKTHFRIALKSTDKHNYLYMTKLSSYNDRRNKIVCIPFSTVRR